MTTETHARTAPQGRPDWLWTAGVIGFIALWYVVNKQLMPFSEWVTALFPVDRYSHTGEAITGIVGNGILAVGFLINLIF